MDVDFGKGTDFTTDPVHLYDDKWWFYDETWAHRYGPWLTEQEAREQLKEYCLTL